MDGERNGAFLVRAYEVKSHMLDGVGEGFRSIEKKIPTKMNKNSQDLIYEMQNNEQGNRSTYPYRSHSGNV
jgi:hypothetical protein